MSIILQSSGGGSVTIAEPTTASNFTATMPAATGTVMVSGNMPAFSATGTGQSFNASTWTKIQFNTEQFDTASCFDSSTNYRFTPNVAGYYHISLSAGHGGSNQIVLAAIYRNGTAYQVVTAPNFTATYDPTACLSAVIYFNGSTDYVEGFINTNVNQTTNGCRFSGAMIRAA